MLTGEEELLQHASLQMKRIAADGQRSPQERFYMKSLRSYREGKDGPQELTLVESVLYPIKQWVDKHMEDYHLHFVDVNFLPLFQLGYSRIILLRRNLNYKFQNAARFCLILLSYEYICMSPGFKNGSSYYFGNGGW